MSIGGNDRFCTLLTFSDACSWFVPPVSKEDFIKKPDHEDVNVEHLEIPETIPDTAPIGVAASSRL